ncbi:hypothetical protein SAMN03159423_5769 [Bradyrhizobium sp. NFR13]|uniref:hypothetical protein n=1 Tax=Bradyrhizobium sp. NFR13 TaxID=1566285 RepID=UPI0008EF7515|nr:hypothetical protein [Bradyrhizobium sp. NFR13]SFM17158.1 hypothetical protein SAMN03159423_5769 [Bradyrhizobium sp. NFR13]
MASLTPLEAAVLQEHGNQLAREDAAALRAQTTNASVLNRENTGAGFYTYFSVERAAAPSIKSDTRQCYIAAKVNGVEDALGFILWLNDGYVDFLEGYTMNLEGTSDLNFTALDFELRGMPPA